MKTFSGVCIGGPHDASHYHSISNILIIRRLNPETIVLDIDMRHPQTVQTTQSIYNYRFLRCGDDEYGFWLHEDLTLNQGLRMLFYNYKKID